MTQNSRSSFRFGIIIASILSGMTADAMTAEIIEEGMEVIASDVFIQSGWTIDYATSHDGVDAITNTIPGERGLLQFNLGTGGRLGYWIKFDDQPWEFEERSTENGYFQIVINYPEDPNHRVWIDEMQFDPMDGGSFQSGAVWGGSIVFSPDQTFFDASHEYVDATFIPDSGWALVGAQDKTPNVRSIGWIEGYREMPTTLSLQVFRNKHRPLPVFGQRVPLGEVSATIEDLFIVPGERHEARFKPSSEIFRSAPSALKMGENQALGGCHLVAFFDGPGIVSYQYHQESEAPGEWVLRTQFFYEDAEQRFDLSASSPDFVFRGSSEAFWIDDFEFHAGMDQLLEINLNNSRHAYQHGGGIVHTSIDPDLGVALVEGRTYALKRGSPVTVLAEAEPDHLFAFWSTHGFSSSGDQLEGIFSAKTELEVTDLVASKSNPTILPVFYPRIPYNEGPPNLTWASDGISDRFGVPPTYANPWRRVDDYSHDGDGSLLAWIDDTTEWSHLLARISGPGLLRFWWAIPAPANGAVDLYYDGERALTLESPANWTPVILPIGTESTGLLWALRTFSFYAAGPVYLDDLSFEAHPFFRQVSAVKDGWMQLDWYGQATFNHWPWLYHPQHGWVYAVAEDDESVFFYDAALQNWTWTNASVYPYIYLFGPHGGWYYYIVGDTPERFYYSFNQSALIREAAISVK